MPLSPLLFQVDHAANCSGTADAPFRLHHEGVCNATCDDGSAVRALALAVTTSGRSGAYETRVDTRARKNDTPKVIASKSTPQLMAKSRRTICSLAYRSDVTPKLIALKTR